MPYKTQPIDACVCQLNNMQKVLDAGEGTFQRKLEEKDTWMYRNLAFEIDRTKALEATLERVRVKYWNRIHDLERQLEEARLDFASKEHAIQENCQNMMLTSKQSTPFDENSVP